jgi:hypothetical protein
MAATLHGWQQKLELAAEKAGGMFGGIDLMYGNYL